VECLEVNAAPNLASDGGRKLLSAAFVYFTAGLCYRQGTYYE